MPIQTYFCPIHKESFDISVPFSRKVLSKKAPCPLGQVLGVNQTHYGDWRPSVVNFIVKEGTGAAKRSPINHA